MNRNGVNFYTRERATSNDFDRAFSGIGKNLMDVILAVNPSFGTTVEKSAVINGFNVTGIDGRTITIGEGLGYVIDRDTDDYESRARLIAVGPSRTETPAEITIEIPVNNSAYPRLSVIYLYPNTTDVTELRDVYNRTTRLFEPSSEVKYSVVSASVSAMSGEAAAVPVLDRAWNPLDADPDNPWPENYLRLYAVYQKGGAGGGDDLSVNDIIDLRWYNNGESYSADDCRLNVNPQIETTYMTSVEDSSNFIKWKSFNGVIMGQKFIIPMNPLLANKGTIGNGCADAFAETQDPELRYCADIDLLTASNRNNRPVYFYALPSIGSMIDPTINKAGFITCSPYEPGNSETIVFLGDSTRIVRNWNMACGDNLDHRYTLQYTAGIFIGSMLVGKNSAGDYVIYGCRRDGNKVWITEEDTDADLPQAGGVHALNPTCGIKIMDYENDDSICGKYKYVNLGGPPVYGGFEAQLMEALPKSARSIVLDVLMSVTVIDGTYIAYRFGTPRNPGLDGTLQGIERYASAVSRQGDRFELPISNIYDGGDWPEWREVHIAFNGNIDCDPGTDRFRFKMNMVGYTEEV